MKELKNILKGSLADQIFQYIPLTELWELRTLEPTLKSSVDKYLSRSLKNLDTAAPIFVRSIFLNLK